MMRKEAFLTIIQAYVLLRCLSVWHVAARFWLIGDRSFLTAWRSHLQGFKLGPLDY